MGNKENNFKILLILLVILSIVGCHSLIKPDLARLYNATTEHTVQQTPVILLHGITGSKLRDKTSLKELWFGSLKTLLFSDYKSLALEIDAETLEPLKNNLEPFDIIGKAAGVDFYHSIIDTLQKYGNYQLTIPGTNVTSLNRRLYVFTYDWRQDNVKSAKKLYHFVNQIKKDYSNPNLKVDLVGHSMGGLVSRYYLRYGDIDVLNDNNFPVNLKGARNVRKVILLGTPNFGSVGAVQSFISGLRVGLRRIPTEVLATMPSVYQLFPHSIHEWLLNINGKPLDRDVFNSEIWRSFQWSIFDPKVQKRIIKKYDDPKVAQAYINTLQKYFHKHIERARRFVWSLTVPVDNPPYKIIVMGGDCTLTPARLLVEEVDGISMTRLKPSQIKHPLSGINYDALMMEPGDGTVTKASLLARDALDPNVARHEYSYFPIHYPYFLCEEHGTLPSNINFEDNLLNILLSH